MLREEVEQYTELTGEDGWHVPIMKVGAYLDGYNKGLEILDKIRAEIEEARKCYEVSMDYIDAAKEQELSWVLEIIDKYKGSEDKE